MLNTQKTTKSQETFLNSNSVSERYSIISQSWCGLETYLNHPFWGKKYFWLITFFELLSFLRFASITLLLNWFNHANIKIPIVGKANRDVWISMIWDMVDSSEIQRFIYYVNSIIYLKKNIDFTFCETDGLP